MALYNYLKCIDGVPAQPFEWTLDPAAIPEKTGVTWARFDTELISPKEVKATLVDGKVVSDPTRKAAWAAEKTKTKNRRTAVKNLRKSGMDMLKALGLTSGEVKALFHEKPTDAELGL